MENSEGPTPVRRTARARKVNSRFVEDADESYKKLVDRITASDTNRNKSLVNKENKSGNTPDKDSLVNGKISEAASPHHGIEDGALNGIATEQYVNDDHKETQMGKASPSCPHHNSIKTHSQSINADKGKLQQELAKSIESFSGQKQPRIVLSRSDAVCSKKGDPIPKSSSAIEEASCNVFSSDGEDDIPLNQLVAKSELKAKSKISKNSLKLKSVTIKVKKAQKKTKIPVMKNSVAAASNKAGTNKPLARKSEAISDKDKNPKRQKPEEKPKEVKSFPSSRLVTHSDLVLEVPITSQQSQPAPPVIKSPVKSVPPKIKEPRAKIDFETALNPKIDTHANKVTTPKKEGKPRKSTENSQSTKAGKADTTNNPTRKRSSLTDLDKDLNSVIEDKKSDAVLKNKSTKESFEEGLFVIESTAGMFVLDTSGDKDSLQEKVPSPKKESSISKDNDNGKNTLSQSSKSTESSKIVTSKQESNSFSLKKETVKTYPGFKKSSAQGKSDMSLEKSSLESESSKSPTPLMSSSVDKNTSPMDKKCSNPEKCSPSSDRASVKVEQSPKVEVKQEEDRHRSRHKSKSSRREHRNESRDRSKHSKSHRRSDHHHRKESSSSHHKSSHRHRSSSDRRSSDARKSIKEEKTLEKVDRKSKEPDVSDSTNHSVKIESGCNSNLLPEQSLLTLDPVEQLKPAKVEASDNINLVKSERQAEVMEDCINDQHDKTVKSSPNAIDEKPLKDTIKKEKVTDSISQENTRDFQSPDIGSTDQTEGAVLDAPVKSPYSVKQTERVKNENCDETSSPLPQKTLDVEMNNDENDDNNRTVLVSEPKPFVDQISKSESSKASNEESSHVPSHKKERAAEEDDQSVISEEERNTENSLVNPLKEAKKEYLPQMEGSEEAPNSEQQVETEVKKREFDEMKPSKEHIKTEKPSEQREDEGTPSTLESLKNIELSKTEVMSSIKTEANIQKLKKENEPVIEVYSTTSEPEKICHAKIKVKSEETNKEEVTVLSESKLSLKLEPDYKAQIERVLKTFREKCDQQPQETSIKEDEKEIGSDIIPPVEKDENSMDYETSESSHALTESIASLNDVSKDALVDSINSVSETMVIDNTPTETPEEIEQKNKEIVAERMKTFELLSENLYLIERKKNHSKEVRRMVCDCFLTKEETANNEMGCGDDCLNRLLMIECGSRCPLGQLCLNRQFQNRTYASIEVFNAANKGCGVRAVQDIRPGTFIMEYIGEVFDYREFRRRRKEYAKDSTSHFYFMALRADTLIDATRKGNISRFVNHSCEPNAETQKWTVNGDIRIGFFSTKHINAGEEINFDYRLERYGREPQKCYCGTPTCRGWLGEAPDEKTREEKEEDKRKELRGKRKREEKRGYFDDLNLANEIDKLSLHGLRNRQDILNLSRLMVRAEESAVRLSLLQLLVNGQQSCKRLFLDYHGLKLLWSWMADIGSGSDNLDLKMEILKVLGALPITNRTQLTESRVFYVVERWSEQESSTEATTASPDIQDSAQNSNITGGSTPTDSTNQDGSSPGDSGDSSELEKISAKEVQLSDGNSKSNGDIKSTNDKEEVISLSSSLIAKWKLLSEAFRIPKKERLQIMKEHEREVEKGFREYVTKQRSLLRNTSSYYDRRSPDKDEQRRRAKRTRRDSWPKMPEFNEEDKHLSKEERREKFALKAAQQEEEARQRRDLQIAIWDYHLHRCTLLGQDPTMTPIFDPSGEFYWEPVSSTWQMLCGMVASLPVPANYQCSPEEECSPRVTTPSGNNLPVALSSLPISFPGGMVQSIMPPTDPCLMSEDMNGRDVASPEPRPPVPVMIKVPSKWRMARTSEGFVYFYHTKTRLTQWEQPSPELHQQLMERYGMEEDSDTESSDTSSSDSGEEFSSEEEEEERTSVVCSADGGGEKMVRRNRGTGRRSEKLVQERVISPILFEDREAARLERRLAKDRARIEARGERTPKTDSSERDDGESPNEDEESEPVVKPKKKPVHYKTKSKTRALNALADNSEKAKKVKENFRMNMATYIVSVLNPYRRADCKQGRITSTEDFKFLARKLTHFVMVKELKQLPNTKKLDCSDSVKSKTKDFVRKYMSKFKEDFKRDPLDTKEY